MLHSTLFSISVIVNTVLMNMWLTAPKGATVLMSGLKIARSTLQPT